LGRISIIVWLDIIYDLGGENIILDFVQHPKIDDPESFVTFGRRFEYGGQLLVDRAIREHLKAGRPVYGMDGRGRIVKQMADGRRFQVRFSDNGDEEIISKLWPRTNQIRNRLR
jgi:hypothetical protein